MINEQANLKSFFVIKYLVKRVLWHSICLEIEPSNSRKHNRSISGVSTDHEYVLVLYENLLKEAKVIRGDERKRD